MASVCWCCLLTYCSVVLAKDPSGSLDEMDRVIDGPRLEDERTAAKAAVREVSEFPSGSCDPRNTTDNSSKDVLETRKFSKGLVAVIVSTGEEIWD